MPRYAWITTRPIAARWARRKTRLRVQLQPRKYPSQTSSRPRTTKAMKLVWRTRTASAARRAIVIRRRMYRTVVLVSTKNLSRRGRVAAFFDRVLQGRGRVDDCLMIGQELFVQGRGVVVQFVEEWGEVGVELFELSLDRVVVAADDRPPLVLDAEDLFADGVERVAGGLLGRVELFLGSGGGFLVAVDACFAPCFEIGEDLL